jgi:hypothetical protein
MHFRVELLSIELELHTLIAERSQFFDGLE